MRRSLLELVRTLAVSASVVALVGASLAYAGSGTASNTWKRMRCTAKATKRIRADGTVEWLPGAGTSTNPNPACGTTRTPQCKSPTSCSKDTRQWPASGTPGAGSKLACACVTYSANGSVEQSPRLQDGSG